MPLVRALVMQRYNAHVLLCPLSYLVVGGGTDAFSSKATTICSRVWGCGLGRKMDRDIPPNKPSLC
jgi:hypothetical protein